MNFGNVYAEPQNSGSVRGAKRARAVYSQQVTHLVSIPEIAEIGEYFSIPCMKSSQCTMSLTSNPIPRWWTTLHRYTLSDLGDKLWSELWAPYPPLLWLKLCLNNFSARIAVHSTQHAGADEWITDGKRCLSWRRGQRLHPGEFDSRDSTS